MRRALLAVTVLLGLAKLISSSAGNAEDSASRFANLSNRGVQWLLHEDAKVDAPFYVQGQFEFSADPHLRFAEFLDVQITPDALNQAPAVRLASISLTAPFRR